MKKLNALFFLVVASALLTACASNPILVPKYSDALNVIRTEYPGTKFQDISYDKYLETRKRQPNMVGNDDTLLADNLILAAGGALTSGFLVTSIFESLGSQEPTKHSHFLIWMPVDGQVDKKAAGDKIYDMLQDNIVKAVRTVYGKDWNIQVEQAFLPNKKIDYEKFSPIRLSRKDGAGEAFYILLSNSRGIYKPKITTAPKFLNNVKSYSWNYIDGFNNFYLSSYTRQKYECRVNHQGSNPEECRKIANPGLQPDLHMYQEISRNMPCWFFVYVAPGKTYLNGKPYNNPVVFNRGKAYYFIEPAPEKKQNLDGRLINGVCQN